MTEENEYTFRYLNAEGRFVAIVQDRCKSLHDAVALAVAYLAEHYEALEISIQDEVVWRGLREDAISLANDRPH